MSISPERFDFIIIKKRFKFLFGVNQPESYDDFKNFLTNLSEEERFYFINKQFKILLRGIKRPESYDNFKNFLTNLSEEERNRIWNHYQPQRVDPKPSFYFYTQNLIFDISYHYPKVLDIVRDFGYHTELIPLSLVTAYGRNVDYLRKIQGYFKTFEDFNNGHISQFLNDRNGYVDIVDFIIELGCISKINYSETDQNPILKVVCDMGSIDILHRIINAGYELNREDNPEMQECLTIICRKKRVDFLYFLLCNGFNIHRYGSETLYDNILYNFKIDESGDYSIAKMLVCDYGIRLNDNQLWDIFEKTLCKVLLFDNFHNGVSSLLNFMLEDYKIDPNFIQIKNSEGSNIYDKIINCSSLLEEEKTMWKSYVEANSK